MSSIKKLIRRSLQKYVFIILSAISLSLPIYSLLQGEVGFHTDIARDFLLMQEAVEKKIMLIGPRASGLEGFFHGPLWIYLNLPFYIIGKGHPLAVGIGWVLINILSLFLILFFAGKLKMRSVFLPAVVFFLVVFAREINSLFNPHGALLLLPVYAICLYLYLKSRKELYLMLSFFILGAIVHLQIAAAGPVFLLSFPLIIFFILKYKNLKHIRSFLALFLSTANYFIFDLRHNFQLSKAVYKYIYGETNAIPLDFNTIFNQRLNLLINKGIYIFQQPELNKAVFLLFILTALYIIFRIKKKNDSHRLFLLFLYLYIGFYVLSLIHKGWLLGHYYLPFLSFPLFLVVLGTKVEKLKYIYILIFWSGILFWSFNNILYLKDLPDKIGQTENSWKYQYKVAKTVFDDNEQEFGFFIFSPDIFAYQTKAAMNFFMNKNKDKNVKIYEKSKITYLIIAPPPENQPWINYKGWKKLKVKLEKEPVWRKKIPPAGYEVQKYILSEEDLKIPPDPNINDWIYFR